MLRRGVVHMRESKKGKHIYNECTPRTHEKKGPSKKMGQTTSKARRAHVRALCLCLLSSSQDDSHIRMSTTTGSGPLSVFPHFFLIVRLCNEALPGTVAQETKKVKDSQYKTTLLSKLFLYALQASPCFSSFHR